MKHIALNVCKSFCLFYLYGSTEAKCRITCTLFFSFFFGGGEVNIMSVSLFFFGGGKDKY